MKVRMNKLQGILGAVGLSAAVYGFAKVR